MECFAWQAVVTLLVGLAGLLAILGVFLVVMKKLGV